MTHGKESSLWEGARDSHVFRTIPPDSAADEGRLVLLPACGTGPICHYTEEGNAMSSPTPISIEAGDALAAAIRLRAVKDGISPEEVVDGILRKALAPELAEASGEMTLAAVIQKVMHANPKGM